MNTSFRITDILLHNRRPRFKVDDVLPSFHLLLQRIPGFIFDIISFSWIFCGNFTTQKGDWKWLSCLVFDILHPVLMAGTWKSAPANYFCTNISFYFRFQQLNFEGGTSPNLQFALIGCKETWKIRRSPGSKPLIFFWEVKSFGDLTFFVQNHENNNKQKMFLRDFPLSIPERDFLKKEPMLFFTNKNPLKNKESHSFAWQNYTPEN